MATPAAHLHVTGRRRFLSQLAAIAGAGLASRSSRGEEADRGATVGGEPASLPTIALGPHRITRLVAGWNPIGGHSYMGHHMDRHMREYFTAERTVEFLLDCERAGINVHQFSSSEKMPEVLRTVRDRGSKMHFIYLHAGREEIQEAIASTRPIAMAHHGGVTDRLFADGKSGEVHDYVKEAHDRGVLAGVSAHNPDCIRRMADEGWEVDFFMCCFYYLTRKGTDTVPGPATLPFAYHFVAADPVAMTAVMRQVRQPCLGFKILGAGRKCGSQESVREAFRWAFGEIKPADGVIVGMYPRFFDEVAADAGYARELARARSE